MNDSNKNVVLIGMPGAGKSTVGVLLAKAMKMPFVDTDLIIQEQHGGYLNELIERFGLEGFKKIEEDVILNLKLSNHIIATGGSVVYSEAAVEHLKASGILVFLNTKMYQLERRLKNAHKRGIAMKSNQTLRALYEERIPLYNKYADIKIDCAKKHIETIVSEIKNKLSFYE